MSTSAIVRDADILSGRWRIAGTMIPVADIQMDYRSGHNSSSEPYQYMGLSPAEITSALSFRFPAIRETEVDLIYGVIAVNCECGETTQQTSTASLEQLVECVCGRVWRIRLVAELISDPSGPAGATT